MIAGVNLRHIRTNRSHDPRHLVTQHGRSRGDVVRREQQVGVTQPRRLDVDERFAPHRRADVHILEIEPATNCIKYQSLHLCPLWPCPTISSPPESGINSLEQDRMVEGLAQELHRAFAHGTSAHFVVAVRRDEDDGYSASFGLQLRLQFMTGYARQANVGDKTRRVVSGFGAQEMLGGAEANRRQPI
jgi:hypothetical protein